MIAVPGTALNYLNYVNVCCLSTARKGRDCQAVSGSWGDWVLGVGLGNEDFLSVIIFFYFFF